MSRLIDADALEREIRSLAEKHHVAGEIEFANGVLKTITRVKAAPTVDAVPIVRCRDCKHFEKAGGSHCTLLNTEIGRHDFCNCAERKDTE